MNQRIKLTKRLLRESLFDLLRGHSLDKISVTELCNAAQINRSTFYTHYSCVRDVMIELEKEIIEDVKRICSEEGSVYERLVRICEYLYEHKQTELVLFRNSSDNDLSEMFEMLNRELWQQRHDSNKMEAFTEDEERLILSFVNYGMYHLVKAWLVEDIQKTPSQIASLTLNYVLRHEIDSE